MQRVCRHALRTANNAIRTDAAERELQGLGLPTTSNLLKIICAHLEALFERTLDSGPLCCWDSLGRDDGDNSRLARRTLGSLKYLHDEEDQAAALEAALSLLRE